MRVSWQRILLLLTAAFALFVVSHQIVASEGDPLALRQWTAGRITLETQWGLNLAIDPTDSPEQLPLGVAPTISFGEEYDHVLTRLPNEANASWVSAAEQTAAVAADANAIRVRSFPLADTSLRAQIVTLDGVSCIFVPEGALSNGTKLELLIGDGDTVLVLSISESSQLSLTATAELVRSLDPATVLINSSTELNDADISRLQTSLEADAPLRISHNTLAVSSSPEKSEKPRIVILNSNPWEMPEAMQKEFAAMEADCAAAQKVFAKLSVTQMNFKPDNGTHTPRWNSEHMMGRQLLFFSQIYHPLDPTIPVMDLNPAQMPPDYEFAHPDWDGAEEARQMQRVNDFTRRFAYLLDGLQLDEQAPGSRWPTLRALLKQMQNHYSEHTANTIKKFDLPNWPQE